MKHIYKKISIFLFSLIFITAPVLACTTVIISGKNTKDGRPLLYKQRDTPSLENKVVSFVDGKYNYVAIVNSEDIMNKEIWGGHNSAGFAIMNSASYNINPDSDSDEKGESSGRIMKLALQTCQTLSDFEHLLDSLPRPLKLSSNFGVIDAFGGAAYYETNNEGYVKFDANDFAQAPLGYLIRTNFSFSGDRSRDKGLSRFQAASQLLYSASLTNNLSFDFLINNVSQSLFHGITGIDLYKEGIKNNTSPQFVAFRDYIPRYLTASVLVVQGVTKDESPLLTTSWITLGFPLITPTIPVWVDGNALPPILVANGAGKSELNEWSLNLKKKVFPIQRGEGSDYLNLSTLLIADGSGLTQKLQPINKTIFKESEDYIAKWRQNNKLNSADIRKYYDWVNQYVTEVYNNTLK